ncbi:MAG TPA: hypothetical protein DER23_07775 [Clostridiales bacterium]|nr:hypothetical protein [Clostridiales bacterium]
MLEMITKTLWGSIMLPAMMILGFILLYRLQGGFVYRWKTIFRNTLGSSSGVGGVSPFSALCTALAGSIGVGNTGGVAAALIAGGPGALFWMWVAGIFGMGIKYAEVYLSVRYRNDRVGGGPMDLVMFALGLPAPAVVLGGVFILSSFGMGNLCQSGTAAISLGEAFGASPFLFSLILGALLLYVLWGGAKSVTTFTTLAIPVFSLLYCLFCLSLIVFHLSGLPQALERIFEGAWGIKEIGGGFSAALLSRATRTGFSRGLFSNEAGMGSTPLAYGMSEERNPEKAGMWGILEVCIDTLLICTLTGLALLVSGVAPPETGAAWTMEVFGMAGKGGEWFLAVSIGFFAFASMTAWGCYGQQAILWLGGNEKEKKAYICLFCLVSLWGAYGGEDNFFTISDVLNALVCLPNMVCLFLLSKEVSFPKAAKNQGKKQKTKPGRP